MARMLTGASELITSAGAVFARKKQVAKVVEEDDLTGNAQHRLAMVPRPICDWFVVTFTPTNEWRAEVESL